MNFVCAVFEPSDEMLTLLSMEKKKVECNLKTCYKYNVRCGINKPYKYTCMFLFSFYDVLCFHLIKGENKVFRVLIRAVRNMLTNMYFSFFSVSFVLIMECSVTRFLKVFVSPMYCSLQPLHCMT